MERKDLLSFNLGPIYMDCLQSFKRELVASITKDGRITEDRLVIKEDFANFEPEGTDLRINPKNAYDKICIRMENRMSCVLLCIPKLDVSSISVTLMPSEKGYDGWCEWEAHSDKRSLSEIIEQGDIIEAFIVWLEEAKLTQWVRECFALRENQIVDEQK